MNETKCNNWGLKEVFLVREKLLRLVREVLEGKTWG